LSDLWEAYTKEVLLNGLKLWVRPLNTFI